MRTRLPTLVLAGLLATVSAGCARPPAGGAATTSPAPTAVSATTDLTAPTDPTDANGMRTGVFPTTRVDPPSDADRPDGAAPVPDADLTEADLTALLRTSASAPATADTCAADEVRLSLTDAEPAAGHRYAQLSATNVSDRGCVLQGWPGIGLRGAWGTVSGIVVEQQSLLIDRVGMTPADPDTPVTLAPGERAAAEFEWTGSLAGSRDEHTSMIVVQLAEGRVPARLVVDPVDIGPDTTVKVGPWGPLG